MKKIIYLILPSLFLMLGAGKPVKNFNAAKTDKQIINDLKKDLQNSKKISKETQEETDANTTEISLEQKILLQGKLDLKIEQRFFKLKLPKDKQYYLVNQQNFYPTDEKKISWKWDKILGEYYYEISVTLDTKQNYILITTTPIKRDETPGTSYTTFTLTLGEDKDVIYFNGETYGSCAYTFGKPIVAIDY